MFSDRRIRTSLIAIVADLILTAIKLVTSWITGSTALLADAYHSLSDILVSLTLLCGICIRVSVEKGRLSISEEKAHQLESILAIIMSCLILYVPVEIIQEIKSQEAEDLQHLWVGIVGILLCIAIAWLMSRLKTWVGKETNSMALVADGYHSQLDVFSSIAVLLSLIGTMIGIYLDEIVAVIIAVMVTIAGLELLISGIKSLLTGAELKQVSLMDKLMDMPSVQHLQHHSKQLRKPANLAIFAALLGTAYLLSGFRIVPHGHVAYGHLLHHFDNEHLSPGLYYKAPWPLGGLVILQDRNILSVDTDSARKNIEQESSVASGLWQNKIDGKSPQVKGEGEFFLSRDENLVDINLKLHFSLEPYHQLLLDPAVQKDILGGYAESALLTLAAENEYLTLLNGPRKPLESRLNKLIREDLSASGLELRYIRSHIQSIKAPPSVVDSHWKRFNAYQKMLKAKLSADSKSQEDLANANAKALGEVNRAQATKAEQIERAEGDINRYLPLQSLFQSQTEALHYKSRQNNLAKQVQGKQLTVIDPKISNQQLRLWLPQNDRR